MDATYRTPAWASGLMTIFILACTTVFVFLLYQHAREYALEEQKLVLMAEVKELRALDGQLTSQIAPDGPLVKQFQTKRKMLDELISETAAAETDANTLQGRCTEGAQAIRDGMDKSARERDRLIQEAKDRRQELAQVETQLLVNERDFETRRAQLRDKIADIRKKLDLVQKTNLKENIVFDTRLAELDERIVELTRQREVANQDVQADGKVLQADATVGFVIIDLGRQHALRKGSKFTIYNRQAGRNVIKGMIEVSKVDESIATCRVIEEKDSNNPIVLNDLLHNPVFDRNKIKGFAVYGAFHRFSKDELKRFIVESGGRFDSDLTVATDYLVAGDNAEDALLQANKLGITILSEEQLIESQLFRMASGPSKND